MQHKYNVIDNMFIRLYLLDLKCLNAVFVDNANVIHDDINVFINV